MLFPIREWWWAATHLTIFAFFYASCGSSRFHESWPCFDSTAWFGDQLIRSLGISCMYGQCGQWGSWQGSSRKGFVARTSSLWLPSNSRLKDNTSPLPSPFPHSPSSITQKFQIGKFQLKISNREASTQKNSNRQISTRENFNWGESQNKFFFFFCVWGREGDATTCHNKRAFEGKGRGEGKGEEGDAATCRDGRASSPKNLWGWPQITKTDLSQLVLLLEALQRNSETGCVEDWRFCSCHIIFLQ